MTAAFAPAQSAVAHALRRVEAAPAVARAALVAVFALVVAAPGLFALPPLDRDEARFAQASAQMLETGDFVVIRFQEGERNKKPVGAYWLQAASVPAFSSVEAREIWAHRLPSLVAAALAAALTTLIGGMLYGPRTGLLAGALLAAAPGLVGEATIAKADAPLLAATLAAQAALAALYMRARADRPAPTAIAIGFWVAVGVGVLVKGPISLMVTGFTGLTLLIAADAPLRRRLVRATRPVAGLVVLAAVLAPWLIAIGRATDGRFFVDAIAGDMLAKVGAAQERHGGPPGYHAALVWLLLWPAAALIPGGLRRAVAERRDWRALFLLGWLAPSWLVFELASTKLPHYALPLYPALAILAARAAETSAGPVARRLGALLYAVVGVAAAGIVAAAPAMSGAASLGADGPARVAGAVGGVGLALASVAIAVRFQRGDARAATPAAILSSACLAWLLLVGVAPRLQDLTVSKQLSAAIDAAGAHHLNDLAPPSVVSGYYEPSAVFLLGTPTIMTDGAAAARAAVGPS
ncbi:MAG: ArnT family glycosyltransferase, partial [Parvularculaceae bacterium]